jgi:hypothetical protein
MVIAILSALRKTVQRELGTLGSIKVNNFFLFVAMMVWGAAVSGVMPVGAYPFLVLFGLILLPALSSDPLDRIPASRLLLWPLGRPDRLRLRAASLALSPVLWAAVALCAVSRKLSWAVAIGPAAVAVQAAIGAGRAPWFDPRRVALPLPGALGGLVRKNLRQMICTLDFYVALALSLAGGGYRALAAHPDPAAFPVFAILVALALSTLAQASFGLDSAAGIARYRLLPLGGTEIVLAKDAAFLAILLALSAPLSMLTALTFGLTALAIGRYPAVVLRRPQRRWRFTGGDLRFGVPQAIVGTGLAVVEQQPGAWFLVVAGALWAVSVYAASRHWERVPLK